MVAFLLLLAGCGVGSESTPAGDSWLETVTQRIQAADRAFLEDNQGFSASTIDMQARLDAQGMSLQLEQELVTIKTIAWGRQDLQALLDPEFYEGACGGEVEPTGDCIARVEDRQGDLLEWWQAVPEGFQQGWEVARDPGGTGTLTVQLLVEGASLAEADNEIQLLTPQGSVISYREVSAWDAEGRWLNAQLSTDGQSIFVEVETENAVWPISIDPLLTTASTTLTGQNSGDRFGISVDGAGDVNNDGYDDVVVGAYRYGSNDNGRAYVYHGSANGVSTNATTTLTGANSNDYFGYAVAGAGDINRDGYDDIVVGAYRYSTYTGRVYIYYGSSTGTASSGATTLTGPSTYSTFGFSLDGAGDVNNDGYNDVIVGAYYYNSTIGRVYVYHGASGGLSTSATTTLNGSGYDEFGWAVAGAGDVNADGYDDVIIGADTYGTYDNGRAYVYHGSSTGIGSTATTTLSGASSYDYFGAAVSGAGDINGDGYADVIVGAPYYGSSDNGRAYVYHGSSTGVSSTATSTITGSSGDDFMGWSVAGAGDVDADGYDDVAVSAPFYGNNSGQVLIYSGSATGLGSSAATTLSGPNSDDIFGIWVAGAGDVNGDTVSDVIVGSSGYSEGNNQGAAYIYHGSAIDADGDGYTVLTDCNDANAAIHPGASESCNNIDDDCDGQVDEGVTIPTWYQDSDGDTYGNSSISTTACTQPSGYVSSNTDCNDASNTIYPGATEQCNGVDDDCDGTVDDGAGGLTWYRDSDSDGYGSFPTQVACTQPSGYVSNGSDCNDQSASVNPAATEICNNLDDNCNGVTDDIQSGGTIWYRDADSDGYGNLGVTTNACSQPSGYVSNSTDCDDTSAARNPGATEVCNSLDDDCDGQIDEGNIGTTWYRDADADAYGDATNTTLACSQPSGYVSTSNDCNDGNAAINPAASEACNGVDDNCNGLIDDNAAQLTWYRDADSDGYGSFPTTLSCAQPTGYVAVGGDCNDSSSAVNPAAPEICDGIDNNCDGLTDQNVASAPVWYLDADGDGYGNAGSTVQSCTQPVGYSANGTDCDDTTVTRSPGAPEFCNGVDDDCDGQIDDAAVDATTWYLDSDSDTYGSSTVTVSCTQPSGYVAASGDCNDGSNVINPGATEACNGVDDDCDGSTDEAGAVGSATYYLDADTDGFGGSSSISSCVAPSGYVSNSNDCDDTQTNVNPLATETAGDLVDSNCDGIELCFVDADGDQYAETTGATVSSTNLSCNGAGEASASVPATDCNDTLSAINPGASELCNAVDDNCNGQVDEGLPNVTTWYQDADGDGYGGVVELTTCNQPSGYVSNSDDCDDTAVTTNPAGTEVCDGADNDCNGQVDEGGIGVTWYADADGDGYGDATSFVQSCAAPTGYVADNTDCDDARTGTNPGASEVCNSIDDDCDGFIDDNATDAATWYLDSDSDGYGNSSSRTLGCTQPAGYASSPYDCDDTDNAFYPGAPESCSDIVDYNCDGNVGYTDADGDGFAACQECNDGDVTIYPGATEVCDNQDNDCDGTVDINAVDGTAYYLDGDGDGYGDGASSITACTLPSGYVADGTDCVDTDATIYVGAPESCNGVDDDCNGVVDDNVVNATVWYADNDGDGYGDPNTSAVSCAQPTGYVSDNTDCEDLFAEVNPGAAEICDGLDNDCNGTVDDSSSAPTWYLDADSDGYGDDSTGVASCTQPTGTVVEGGDCNDADAAYHPYALESCTDSSDYNCDGSTGNADLDADGVVACLDCNDQDINNYPGNIEVCDGQDNDCNALADDNATNAGIWYADADGDNYGDLTIAVVECNQPTGYVSDSTDCNDQDAAFYPGAPESCDATLDYNCDGSVGFVDNDLDGFGACEECNDADASAFPGGTEYCDGVDNNCDGNTDEEAVDASIWYQDADGDTYGNPAIYVNSCISLEGYVANAEDCRDDLSLINPDAEEICDTLDNNCNGEIDEVCDSGDSATDSFDSRDVPPSETGLFDTGKDSGNGTCGCETGSAGLWLGLLGISALLRRKQR